MVGGERCKYHTSEIYYLIEDILEEMDKMEELLLKLEDRAKILPWLPSYTDKR